MQAFMLYMSGSGVQIFSMGTVFMLLSNPIKGVLGIQKGELRTFRFPSFSFLCPLFLFAFFALALRNAELTLPLRTFLRPSYSRSLRALPPRSQLERSSGFPPPSHARLHPLPVLDVRSFLPLSPSPSRLPPLLTVSLFPPSSLLCPTQADPPLPRSLPLLLPLTSLALGLWKCNQMGILPTGSADFLAFETRGPVSSFFPLSRRCFRRELTRPNPSLVFLGVQAPETSYFSSVGWNQ